MNEIISRRNMLKTASLGAAGLALGRNAFAQSARQSASRPNIILIMADDMGYSDLGCYGSEIETPILDYMGHNGLRFTNFYNAARCCPTRASLLTGLYPHQAGVGHMINDLGYPGYRGFLNDRCVTIAEALRASGYRTLISGKWHVGENRPHWPLDRGFDEYYGLISGASNFWRLDPGRNFARDNTPIKNLGPNFYKTDAFSDNAVAYIDKHGRDEAPFFLYVPYTAPHWPLHAHPEDIETYVGRYKEGWDALREERYARGLELGTIDPRWKLSPRDAQNPSWEEAEHKEWQDMRMAVYAAQIECMDRGIGQMLDKVRELGIEDKTLFLFLVDNGGCHEGRPGNDPEIMPGPADTFQSYGRAWAEASNTPFRMYKHWVHEGGVATPLVAYWPGRIQPGGITDQIGHIIDFMPTCLDLAGAEYPEEYNGKPIQPVEGKSLVPIFEGGNRDGHEAIFWEHKGNCAVRQEGWKLVTRHGGDWELYDMIEDRSELNDLAGDRADKLHEMVALYDDWADRAGVLPWDVARHGRG